MTLNQKIEKLKAKIFALSVPEMMQLMREIEDKIETLTMMKLAETGFAEWEDPEEDIYNVQS